MSSTSQPITLLLAALGGEGGGVLSEWLVLTAQRAGYAVQSTSIPGVAQRTGATTYYIEVFPVPVAQLAGRRPVFSLNPLPGRLDGLVSSELLETSRQIGSGVTSPERTLIISSNARTLTTLERMQPGDGRQDGTELLALLRSQSRAHHVLDMAALARESGTVVSAVMLGAVAASGLFPFAREHYEATVRAGGVGVDASLRGFARAFEAVAQQRTQTGFVEQVLGQKTETASPASIPALPAALAAAFPGAVHELLALGHARVCEYQDAAYGELYVQRLNRVLQAEQQADPEGHHRHAVTREMARWLALWMAFDDIVRVADLKSRASRWQRMKGEVKAQDSDLVHLYDHFKPGAPEFAALLPAGLAQRVLAWDQRRVARGLDPWALPLKIGTHSVVGMAALRTLASLRWLRRRGSRFGQEQALIEQWLAAVEQGTREDWALGHELALCGRLIKGYGSTNERSKDNLLHVVRHLASTPTLASPAARASAIGAARRAALADATGKSLDSTLASHGAPAREVKAQPIRWMRRPTAPAAKAGV